MQHHSAAMSPLMISPNSSHFCPRKRCICNWLIGAKSVAEVLILTPGSSVSGVKSFRLIVVLIEDRDLGARLLFHQPLRIDLCFVW
jgi:hypothetical protein